MANSSVYSVFERMWQHVLTKFNNCVSNDVFETHTSNTENPHEVTAEQVGALPTTGGVMEGAVTLNGIILTEGIDYGAGDPGGGTLGQIYFKKVSN